MANDSNRPYDFTLLDDTYHSAEERERISTEAVEELKLLTEEAYRKAEEQDPTSHEEYLKWHIIAQWRALELAHAENAALRGGREMPFLSSLILGILMTGSEMEEEFVALAAGYSRDELLKLVSTISQPWLDLYRIRLSFDSDEDYRGSDWRIFIDVPMSR
jgi:hypothetical protein